ncbi:MAG TPA: TonB C-terminal domain-containing protein [Casimicrobiaceae bacterium]|nr:TonB C-terminal domain-containing protein [Casimicrobiaceae bacterium]
MTLDRRRLTFALLLSLLVHASLLSITFGDWDWLPRFGFTWQHRRIEAPDLRVALVPAPVAAPEAAVTPSAEPSQQARVEQPVVKGPTLTPSAPPATDVRIARAAVPEANPEAQANPKAEANPKVQANPKTQANPTKAAATPAATAKAPLRADRPRNTPPQISAPAVIALERIDENTWVVPAIRAMSAPVIVAAPSAAIAEPAMSSLPDAGDAARARINQEAPNVAVELGKLDTLTQGHQQAEQLEAALQAAAREAAALQEAARQVAERQEAALQAAARQEAQRGEAARQAAARGEAARQETARADAARREAERQAAETLEAAETGSRQAVRQATALQEAAQQATAQQEAALQEAARQAAALQEAARQEAAQREAERIEAARQEAERQETARQETARQEAARVEAARQEAVQREAVQREAERQEATRIEAQEAEARREARLRAIGRELDEEAAQREAMAAARPSPSLPPPSWSPARRYRLFGRTDPNEEIILYAEAWERKIELNMTFDMISEALKQPHTDPMVTVAIRSDGSVESVTFVASSGVAAIDNAIRFIIDSQKPYRAFPPNLSREWDVLEIRRTWHFDMAIRLY